MHSGHYRQVGGSCTVVAIIDRWAARVLCGHYRQVDTLYTVWPLQTGGYLIYCWGHYRQVGGSCTVVATIDRWTAHVQ
jgi:hypothetical protein